MSKVREHQIKHLQIRHDRLNRIRLGQPRKSWSHSFFISALDRRHVIDKKKSYYYNPSAKSWSGWFLYYSRVLRKRYS